MDAIILAAGLGTRLRPYTLTTPKPLLSVQGRPILDWILSAMPPEVTRVVVVVNYLAEQIEEYLKGQSHFPDWTAVRQEQPRGTGDALRCCRGEVHSERFLVLNGDDLYGSADLFALLQKPTGLLVHPVDEPAKFGIVFTNPDGSLERLEEKPNLEGRQQANIGAYLFPRKALDIDLPLSKRGEYEITDAVSLLAKEAPFYAVPANFWLPIGTVEAWNEAQGVDLSPVDKGELKM
jgi:bifunctional UDP-N-acetylglucosamine pyrophosphorylase/glucosamine-1-phosphate N-acetyltransferase